MFTFQDPDVTVCLHLRIRMLPHVYFSGSGCYRMFTEDSASMGAVCSAMAGSTSTGTNQENSRTGVGIILNNPDVKSIALMRVLNTFFYY